MSAGQERGQPSEPNPWRSLVRLLRETLHIAFYVGLERGVKLLVRWTGQEHEWWAPLVINGAAVFFVIGFFVIAGGELVADCWEAMRATARRIRGR